jgi:hypothetical protein
LKSNSANTANKFIPGIGTTTAAGTTNIITSPSPKITMGPFLIARSMKMGTAAAYWLSGSCRGPKTLK